MQVHIEVRAYFDTPFSIGTGALAQFPTDKPLMKDASGYPYVPGATLKGRLRHACEALLRALGRPADAVCQSPSADTMCPQVPVYGGPPCPICRIFGSPWNASPLVFSDLCLPRMAIQPSALHSVERFGVSLSRRRGVAQEDLLYSTEVVPATVQLPLEGSIAGVLATAERWPVALLLGGLQFLPSLGGGKSRGLGWCRLEGSTTIDAQPLEWNLQEELQRWLAQR